jgi:endogenous inhibitor of DNA gyrase (YacG/DUF329 family)
MVNTLTETFKTVECPACHAGIFVNVVLTVEAVENIVKCPSCKNDVVVSLPCRVLEGPYSAGA